jgi:hypothetical protein
MKQALIIFSVLMTFSTFAETVKVVSRLETAVSNGSGWLVETPIGAMIVTCPHVLMPKGTTDIFLEKSDAPLSAHEVWSDWARGISLLKLDSPLARIRDRFDSTEALANVSVSRGDKVLVEGFPSAQTQEAFHGGGIVALAQTRQPFLPLAEGVEIIRTHAERGMSCGPVSNASTHQLIGILSNQIPQFTIDRDTKYVPIAQDKVYENAFAVSAREIARAFNLYVQQGPHSGDFELLSTPDDDHMIVGFGNFVFSFTKGKDGSFQVAGGTGGGVGGVERATPGSIEVTIKQTAKEKTPPRHLVRYFDSWKNVLYSGRRVIVDGFVKKDEKLGYVRQDFETIEEFVRLLMQPESIPFGRINHDLAQVARVQKTATDMRQLVLDIKAAQKQPGAKLLLENLQSTSALLSEDYGAAIVKADDLAVLADPSGRFHADWVLLTNDKDSSQLARLLMGKLFELIQSL